MESWVWVSAVVGVVGVDIAGEAAAVEHQWGGVGGGRGGEEVRSRVDRRS